jgi:hypothetical protein
MSYSNETPFTGLGLFQSLFQNHNQQMSLPMMTPQVGEQMMRGYARWQAEVQGLMARRAQAYMELPNRLAQCRTPQDIVQEQQRFWKTCFEQYGQSSQQIMQAFMQMMAMPLVAGLPSEPANRHDYLSFPEPRSNGVAGQAQAARPSDRKVA